MERPSDDLDLQSDSPRFSWHPTRPSESSSASGDHVGHPAASSLANDGSLPDFLPGTSSSLSSISLRAFILGQTFAASLICTLYLAFQENRLWRASSFLTALSLFHFLEFWVTARFNPRRATVSSFLLSTNGSAYNIAHTTALIECIFTRTLLRDRAQLPPSLRHSVLFVGLAMVTVGQLTRSMAMAQAGTNFNHTVQTTRRREHELVTKGIYAYLRHPSYFGFFWWGLGTQVLMGNVICFLAYMAVLWLFFSKRIRKEEQLLISFFGKEYEEYRRRTPVGIPFIH
ncbi:MAG: hypothetical protein M1817_001311 [Caeruleum heppii]|nr:MAG: hypothetical protein M1817_001311 [Caeruleum heppii]